MDIDLSTNLDGFKPMIAPLITGDAGLATGSRLMKQSRTTRGFKREFISRCYNRIIRTTMKTKFVDAQCGFKALRRDVAQKLLPHVKDTAWFFVVEHAAAARTSGNRDGDASLSGGQTLVWCSCRIDCRGGNGDDAGGSTNVSFQ